jgi:preprotein translocase subunit YajC
MTFLFILIALGIVFWFIAIQPQRRRQNAHVAMQDAVAQDIEIITAGGLHGIVVEAGDEILLVEIAPEVIVRLDRRAVAAVVEPPEEEAEEAEEPEEPEEEDLPTGESGLPPAEGDENPNEKTREAR